MDNPDGQQPETGAGIDPDSGGRRLLRRVRMHRSFAIVLAPLGVGLALIVDRVGAAIGAQTEADRVPAIASVALLAVTILYLASWWYGSELELNAVEDIGSRFLIRIPRSTGPIIVATALALMSLALASPYPAIFASLLFFIKLVELWASWPLTRLVREATERISEREPPDVRAAVAAVRAYYLESPWVQLSAVVIGLMGASLFAAAYALGSGGPYFLGVIASGGLMAAIVVQEAGTWRYRVRYGRALDQAFAGHIVRARGRRRLAAEDIDDLRRQAANLDGWVKAVASGLGAAAILSFLGGDPGVALGLILAALLLLYEMSLHAVRRALEHAIRAKFDLAQGDETAAALELELGWNAIGRERGSPMTPSR